MNDMAITHYEYISDSVKNNFLKLHFKFSSIDNFKKKTFRQ